MIFCLLSLYYQYAPVCNERTDTRFLREEHGDTWPFKLAVKQSSHNLSPFSEPPEGHTAICLTDIQRPCVSEHRMFCVCVCVVQDFLDRGLPTAGVSGQQRRRQQETPGGNQGVCGSWCVKRI